MIKNNLHTHTVYCDGKNTPEELVEYAISQNCEYIGFSGHSYTDIPDDSPFCMTRESTEKYKSEINRLKLAYKDKIKIYLGVEQDFYSEESTDDYDYVIGSVHYVHKNGEYISVDHSKVYQIDAVDKYYGGDYYAFAEDYYALAGRVYEKTRCDIVGHFDLVTKFNENNALFDTGNPRYVNAADGALNKLLKYDLIFEKNFGAISRGYRITPYPEPRIENLIKAAGKKIIATSDCHEKKYLLFGIQDEENRKIDILR